MRSGMVYSPCRLASLLRALPSFFPVVVQKVKQNNKQNTNKQRSQESKRNNQKHKGRNTQNRTTTKQNNSQKGTRILGHPAKYCAAPLFSIGRIFTKLPLGRWAGLDPDTSWCQSLLHIFWELHKSWLKMFRDVLEDLQANTPIISWSGRDEEPTAWNYFEPHQGRLDLESVKHM